MLAEVKRVLKSLAPPVLWDAMRQVFSMLKGNAIRFVGDYKSWADAEAASTGYSAQDILDRTIKATRRVKIGEAAFERDGVTFPEMECNFPLAWAFMRAAARHGRLHVLDFGGALGSTYFQSRALINAAPDIRWAIVEQPAHVAAGASEFGNDELSFHLTIDLARQHSNCDVLLLSGVIQCLPDPFSLLDSVLALEFPSIILDRTPFMVDGVARLTVQHVPEWIYPASYPAWFFSEDELLARFAQKYDLIVTWPALDRLHPQGGLAEYKGFLFELRKE